MKGNNVIKGPILPTVSNLVYSVTLLSGNVVTNPSGFGLEEDSNWKPNLEDLEPVAEKEKNTTNICPINLNNN